MAFKSIRKLVNWGLLVGGSIVWLSSLLLLAQTVQNTGDFGRLHNWILLLNVVGVLLLLVLIGGNIYRLVRDYRKHALGSRLKPRMVSMFALLAVVPLLLVYYFSVQFLNRGIESWFQVEVESGLRSALDLSRVSLELRMREYMDRTTDIAEQLSGWPDRGLVAELGLLRRESGASEVSVIGQNRRIVATSSDRPAEAVPASPSEEVMFQIRQGNRYVSLDQPPDGGYVVRTAAPLAIQSPIDEQRFVLVHYPVAERLSTLADAVQAAYVEYNELAYLREPLKFSFTLTLTLVLLLALLGAVYGAFFLSNRLVQPVFDLVAGTRAVAKGDFDTLLPLPAQDELGFLVNSFNDMTKRLGRAREDASRSQQQVEDERARLAAILARLSTGVVSFDGEMRIRTANEAAGTILGVDLASRVGETLTDLAEERPLLQQFLEIARGHIDAGQTEWREQILLRGEVGRRVLMCACTALPGEGEDRGGYVVVFDDITGLLQAQRDAAWGEVARRLAHEIKNPLTPIQLSAERLRRRYLPQMGREDSQLLDRATHTIIQQVEAMKEMVDAFRDYARAPDLELDNVDLNQLVSEVADLYRSKELGIRLILNLDSSIERIEADPLRLRQIVHNLVRNSQEALEGRESGTLEVTTRRMDHGDFVTVDIIVEDDGPGFAGDDIARIFDPYVTSKPKGTGLGLAIVKKLVEEHGGQIEASNRSEGGARVEVRLPMNDKARSAMLLHGARAGEVRRELA
jgi:PAS domain S-box-containing protein